MDLILWAGGMLCHTVWHECQPRVDVWANVRSPAGLPAGLCEPCRVLTGNDAVRANSAVDAFAETWPDPVM